jgi:ferredoxin
MVKSRNTFVKIDRDSCDLCGTCVAVCPENVIRMSAYFLEIDHSGCTRCQKCIWVCPVSSLEMIEGEIENLIDYQKV